MFSAVTVQKILDLIEIGYFTVIFYFFHFFYLHIAQFFEKYYNKRDCMINDTMCAQAADVLAGLDLSYHK